MTDAAVLGAGAFFLGLIALVLVCGALVHLWHDWAADRRREAEYAEAYRRTHQRNQDLGRYGYDVDGRPE